MVSVTTINFEKKNEEIYGIFVLNWAILTKYLVSHGFSTLHDDLRKSKE